MPPRKRKALHSEITLEEYDRICEVYRRHHGYSKAVADELGWPVARTKRAYYRGWPSRDLPPIVQTIGRDSESSEQVRAKRQAIQKLLPPSEPIESVEEIEQKAVVIHTAEQARIKELVRQEEARRRAREDAIEARSEEAMLIGINRRNAIALNGVTAQLMKGAVELSKKIQQELEDEAATGTLSVQAKLNLVRSAASVARFNSEATMLAIKSERMVLGQPIEAAPDTPDDGTLEQAVEWIERSVKAVKRARERGLLTPPNGETH